MPDLTREQIEEGERLMARADKSTHAWPVFNCCVNDAHDDALEWLLSNIDALLAAAKQRDELAAAYEHVVKRGCGSVLSPGDPSLCQHDPCACADPAAILREHDAALIDRVCFLLENQYEGCSSMFIASELRERALKGELA